MRDDVRKMIRIRKEQTAFFKPMGGENKVDIFPIPIRCEEKIPIPYAIQTESALLIVAGNNTDEKVSGTLSIPLEKCGLDPEKTYTVVDLWSGEKRTVQGKELRRLPFSIKKDKVSGGGIALFKIQK